MFAATRENVRGVLRVRGVQLAGLLGEGRARDAQTADPEIWIQILNSTGKKVIYRPASGFVDICQMVWPLLPFDASNVTIWTPLLRDGRSHGSSPRRLHVRPVQAVPARPPCLGASASSVWTRLRARAATLPPPCSFLRLACLFSRPGRGCAPARWRRSVIRGDDGHVGRSIDALLDQLPPSAGAAGAGRERIPPWLGQTGGVSASGLASGLMHLPGVVCCGAARIVGAKRGVLDASSYMSQRDQGLQLAVSLRAGSGWQECVAGGCERQWGFEDQVQEDGDHHCGHRFQGRHRAGRGHARHGGAHRRGQVRSRPPGGELQEPPWRQPRGKS